MKNIFSIIQLFVYFTDMSLLFESNIQGFKMLTLIAISSTAITPIRTSNVSSWPSFYAGESSHPTSGILSSLEEYQRKWESLQSSQFDSTYSFTMGWECSHCSDECYQANYFIHVESDDIQWMTLSEVNSPASISSCDNTNDTQQLQQYKTIDELFDSVIDWVEAALDGDTTEYLIITLLIHPLYYFPMEVKLSEHSNFIAWTIPCFEPGLYDDEGDVCKMTTQQQEEGTFWITEQMQKFIGWSMMALIFMACSLGYCINFLKKKKAAKIAAWKEAEEQKEQKREERRTRKRSRSRNKKKERKLKGANYSMVGVDDPIVHSDTSDYGDDDRKEGDR